MKHIYRFHPSEYELGENEKFYSDMEARGWRLASRGRWLSRFAASEPSRTRYRVEVSCPAFLEERGLSEGQLAVFEDCGWEYVDSGGFLHIFRTPEDSGAPEFYTDPRQQAATLKKVRRDLWWGWGTLALVVLGFFLWAVLDGESMARNNWRQFRRFVELPGYLGLLACWTLCVLCNLVRGTWRVNRTYFRLKRGVPLDHEPKGRRTVSGILNWGIAALAAVSLLSIGGQCLAARSMDLPERADGPYLLLADVGVEGERSELWYGMRESGVTYASGLAAEYWDVFEVVGPQDGRQVWMYQDVYRMRLPALAMPMARALMETAVFPQSWEEFEFVEVPGLDAAWVYGRLEAVAVKGDLVAHLEYLASSGGQDAFDPGDALAALAGRWGAQQHA